MLFVILTVVACARQIIEPFAKLSNAKQLRKLASLSEKAILDFDKPPLSALLVPRVSGSKGNLQVQRYLIDTFITLGWTVEQDEFEQNTPFGLTKFNNIIATSDPKAHKKIVLACHFDSKYFESFEFIGATDSSAPCAILINVAQTLNDALKKRKEVDRSTTVQLLFLDGEEAMVEWTDTDSIYGARHLAEKWSNTFITMTSESGRTYIQTPLQQIEAFLLLDLLGWKGQTVPNSQASTQWVWDRIVRIQDKIALLKLSSLDLQTRVKNGNPIFRDGSPTMHASAIQDDHVPFMKRGVPICHLIAVPFPAVWHTQRDNRDALDMDSITDLALIFRILVAEYLGLIDYI
jgi:hypothetical protein